MSIFFFFNDTATTEIYTLSLHDALPISLNRAEICTCDMHYVGACLLLLGCCSWCRSEEHTSELQSRRDLVCRLLLEKKKKYREWGSSFRIVALPRVLVVWATRWLVPLLI